MDAEVPLGSQATQEVQLMEEVFRCPDLQHEVKGRRTRDILRFLLVYYQQYGDVSATEDEVATAVYGGPEVDQEDSTVRRRISAARARLKKFCDSLHTSRSLRVRIPDGQYRLEFYREFLRFGVQPTEWFWHEYQHGSKPAVMGFVPPEGHLFHERDGSMCPEDALALYHTARTITSHQPDPNFMRLLDWGHFDALMSPKHKLLFGIAPVASKYLEEMWKRRKDLHPIVMFREPTGKIVISVPNPPRDSQSHYVHGFDVSYVLVTRFTVPKEKTQITAVVAHDPEIIIKVMQTLTSDEKLFPVVTEGALGNSALDQQTAPPTFQLVFEVWQEHRVVINAINHARIGVSEPHLRLVCVFGKELENGILVNKRDLSAFPPLARGLDEEDDSHLTAESHSTAFPPITPPKRKKFRGHIVKLPGTPYEGDSD